MTITLKMPGGGKEKIKPASVLVVREPLDFERDESPEVQAMVLGSGYRLYPAVSVNDLINLIGGETTLVRLTAPTGTPLFVNAERVTDRDARSAIVDHEETNSVLLFGPGPNSNRIRVRETKEDLVLLWQKHGLDVSVLD
ncbi:hypothetical protein [Roseibium aggregatum]|uniref:Uncharacterized protein n=1 Tax=Roseibium aggregatum TaxID=187304 RepID=A0A939EH23_9HYPH|nr:hypothetical protein [Roseibium aggregatum]MBN9673067.1 hypothetical protein [Roseibium aggregatum]